MTEKGEFPELEAKKGRNSTDGQTFMPDVFALPSPNRILLARLISSSLISVSSIEDGSEFRSLNSSSSTYNERFPSSFTE